MQYKLVTIDICCSAIHFPLSGHIWSLHQLECTHSVANKKVVDKIRHSRVRDVKNFALQAHQKFDLSIETLLAAKPICIFLDYSTSIRNHILYLLITYQTSIK